MGEILGWRLLLFTVAREVVRSYQAYWDADKKILMYRDTEFLKRLLVLIHMASGQPLRESELFSVTWQNIQRRRHVYLKHGLVMLYTTYYKGQQQTGKFKDNIQCDEQQNNGLHHGTRLDSLDKRE
jgi:hypothetical protein